MSAEKINARYITKPIQLWAAWLAGLTIVVGIFLETALRLSPSWERSALIVASITYVPIFLLTAVVLQTRFRFELQEDAYYSRTVKNRKTDSVVTVTRIDALEAKLELAFREIALQLQPIKDSSDGTKKRIGQAWSNWKVALNTHHPEYVALKAAFSDAKIPIAVAFGEKPPKKWIAAINENMPKDLALQVLSIAARFNFDGFVFWNPIRDVGETEDVYFGSYGQGPYNLITADFPNAIVDELSLTEYMVAHQKKE